jgi:hypothetical protein
MDADERRIKADDGFSGETPVPRFVDVTVVLEYL